MHDLFHDLFNIFCGPSISWPKLEEREKYILFALYVHKFKYIIISFFLVAARRWILAGEAKAAANVKMGWT